MYRHYITIDENNHITDGWSTGARPGIGSGAGGILLTDQGGYEFELQGVKDPPLKTEDGFALYKWTGSTVEKRSTLEIDSERAEKKAQEEKQKKESRISELKRELADTDYAVIKIAEGAATQEDYAELIEQREQWREEIRDLTFSLALLHPDESEGE